MKAAEREVVVDGLKKSQNEVKKYGFLWKRAKDKDDLKDVLSNVASLVYELRSSELSPKQYYTLFMDVTNELHGLDGYFLSLNRAGMPMEELYRRVQETPKVLPRLYLLAVAGAVYIQSKEAAAKHVLKDLVEMAKGVQYPMRALFLRNFIHTQTRKLLPDIGNEYAGEGGSVDDSIDFILQNFTQMNKLWVRMQYMGLRRRRGRTMSEKQKSDRLKRKKERETQRKELKILVGLNLQRLSSLEGVTAEVYSDKVLPGILEQVTNCRDTIAQEYLMDLIIHGFTCEYHLQTLDAYLGTCAELMAKVNVSQILQTFMNRLSAYAAEHTIPTDVEIFKKFDDNVKNVIDSTKMPLVEILELKHSQLGFALKCASSRAEQLVYAGHILGFCAQLLGESSTMRLSEEDEESKLAVRLLLASIEELRSDVLNPQVTHFGEILKLLPWAQRKQVSVALLSSVINEEEAVINTPALAKTLLEFVAPLVKDEEDASGDHYSGMGKAFVKEQIMMAKFVQRVDSEDPAVLFKMYQLARQQFGEGGTNRIKYTLLPLVFGALKLIDRVTELGPSCGVKLKRLFGFAHETITALASNHPNLSLRLFLQTSLVADRLSNAGAGKGFSPIAYEFIVQSFILYEDMSSAKEKRAAVAEIVGSLYQCTSFATEEFETMVTRVTQYAAKLLLKPDQNQMVQLCCHLFWTSDTKVKKSYEDTRRVLECLQRCLKVADKCSHTGKAVHTQLFVDVLNSYLHYFEQGCPTIKAEYITGLLALINANLTNDENTQETTKTYFRNTLNHIRCLKENPKFEEKFQAIEV